jgi:hypothetical protein
MKKYIVLLSLPLLMAACGEPNHYDSHAGDKASKVKDDRHDTIQGRARHPDSIGVTDTTNIGIGDTTLVQTPH